MSCSLTVSSGQCAWPLSPTLSLYLFPGDISGTAVLHGEGQHAQVSKLLL